MKRIYIHGSFMNDNFGDFLLCAKIVSCIREKHKNVRIHSANISPFYNDFMKIDSYNLKTALKNADLAVCGGGGYFGEPNHHKIYWNIRMLIKHAKPITTLLKNKVPVCIAGVGVGPLSFKISQKIVKRIFEHADLVAVRDKESKAYLEQYGVKRDILVYPDWIMSCDKEDLIKERKNYSLDIYSDKILIHLASKNTGANSPINIILNDIERLIMEDKEKFLIITDQKDNGQIERGREIFKRFSKYGVKLYQYHDPYELCMIIDNAKAVITDKLHVGIVATRLGVPAFSVAYHNKIVRFYRQVGRENYSIPIDSVKSGIVYRWINHSMQEKIEIDTVIREAKGNERLVNSFLDKYLYGYNV